MARHNLDVGMRCIKFMLLCLTAMFVLTSVLIISVGMTIYALHHDVSQFLDARFLSPASLLVAVGIIMLLVAVLGCVGALRESTCLVNIFAVTLTAVLVLELAAAAAAYSQRREVASTVYNNLKLALPLYQEDPEIKDAFDFVQHNLNCCGIDSYEDWGTVPLSGHDDIAVNNITVPGSCCAETRYEPAQCVTMYSGGCLPHLVYSLSQSARLLATGALTVAFIQIIGIAFSFSLASAIRKTKSERERRRWEIQEQLINAASLFPDNEKKTPVVYVPFQGQTVA